MAHRFLIGLSIGLVFATLTVPLARAGEKYDGYKSGFPELRQIREFARTHQIVVAKAAPASNPFDWPDAAIGAGTAATTIFLLAAGVLFVGRRRTRVAV